MHKLVKKLNKDGMFRYLQLWVDPLVDIEGGVTGAGRIKTADQRVPMFAHDGTTVAASVVMVSVGTAQRHYYH